MVLFFVYLFDDLRYSWLFCGCGVLVCGYFGVSGCVIWMLLVACFGMIGGYCCLHVDWILVGYVVAWVIRAVLIVLFN